MKRSWILPSLFFLFLFIRVIFLLTFPPFTDESHYIRWGQLMIDNPSFRWASIAYVHRQPLTFWLFGISAIITHSPLIGARLITLLFSIPTFFMVYTWLKDLSDEETAWIGLVLLIFSPVYILFQSLALMDGFLFAIALAITWLLWKYWKHADAWKVVAIGILTGLGIWIKTNILIMLAVTTGYLFVLQFTHRKKSFLSYLLPFVPLAITTTFALPLIVRPDFSFLVREPDTFTFAIPELLHMPLLTWMNNGIAVVYTLLIYLTPVPIVILLLGMRKLQKKNALFLFAWCIVTIGIVLILLRSFRTRYILFALPPTIPLMALAARKIIFPFKTNIVMIILIGSVVFGCGLLVLSPPSFFSLFPKNSPVQPERDYAFGWPAGYGIPQAIQFIDHSRNPTTILSLAVVDSPGNPSDYVLAYYYFNPGVRILFVTTSSLAEFRKIEPASRQIPIYLITRDSLIPKDIHPYLQLVKRFSEPNNEDAISISKIQF